MGKSICYQIPALSRFDRTGALTVVISPLVALMAHLAKWLTGESPIVLTEAADRLLRHGVAQERSRGVGHALRAAGSADQGRLKQ